MHTVVLSAPVHTARWNLPAGKYLMEDLSAFELGVDAERGTARLVPADPHRADPGFRSGDRVLLIANGGFGDAVLMTPALRKFKSTYPTVTLALSCRARIHPMFDHLPYAPTLMDYPVDAKMLEWADHVLTFEHLQEASEEGRTVAAVDIKARVLGVAPLIGDERRAEYAPSTAEIVWANQKYGKNSRQRIGVQLAASSPTRTYHPQRAGEVMRRLFDLGYELYIFGSPGSLPKESVPVAIRSRVRNLTAEGLTFRESAAVLTTCDCVWAPDSSLMHLAGVLGLPCVAVFGSTHWTLRTADYPSVIALQSNVGCPLAPCWHHPRGHHHWPTGGICTQKGHEGHCTPLNSIPPQQIVEKIQKQLAAQKPN